MAVVSEWLSRLTFALSGFLSFGMDGELRGILGLVLIALPFVLVGAFCAAVLLL